MVLHGFRTMVLLVCGTMSATTPCSRLDHTPSHQHRQAEGEIVSQVLQVCQTPLDYLGY
jgi:hypothetical protein